MSHPLVISKDFRIDESSEKKAARKLVSLFEALDTDGAIIVASNVSLPGGEKVKDIDIVVVGWLDSYVVDPYIRAEGTKGYDSQRTQLCIQSFCFTIELKDHDARYVQINELGNIEVSYSKTEDQKDVTNQSFDQRDSLRNCLYRKLSVSPFVTNLIWLQNVSSDQFLAKVKDCKGYNVLLKDFTAEDLFCIAADFNQGIWNKKHPLQYIMSSFKNDSKDKLLQICEIFLTKTDLPAQDYQKVNRVAQGNAELTLVQHEKMTLLKGRAGTGKTISLLQFANKRVKEDGARCLFLTFNHALLSDVKRLAALCDLPDGLEAAFVPMTMQSFFMSLIRDCGIGFNQSKPFNQAYDEALFLLNTYLNKQDNSIKRGWNYILIDEGQDWKESEKNIITNLYAPSQIVVADGIDQFVRKEQVSPWLSLEQEGKASKLILSTSLRQKPNLVAFNNRIAEISQLAWSVKPSNSLNGGTVIITNQYGLNRHQDLLRQCVNDGGSAYDMLFLLDSTAGNEKYIGQMLDFWDKRGIKAFNGIDPENRTRYASVNECRVYNYNSCRGLEGWVVVCHNLDRLIEEKMKYTQVPALVMETPQDHQKRIMKSVYQWLMMPLTRAIDTLVITVDNPQSDFCKLLKQVADGFDFVNWQVQE